MFYLKVNLVCLNISLYQGKQGSRSFGSLAIKNFDATSIIDQVLAADEKRRTTQAKADNLQAELKSVSKDIGTLFKEGRGAEAKAAQDKTSSLKEDIKNLQQEFNEASERMNQLLVQVPNLPH